MNGREYLIRIPPERWFQLFVDGRMHATQDGWKAFESREPGCLKGFFDGLSLVLQQQNKKFDADFISLIHKTCTQNIGGEIKKNIEPGRFRIATELTYFGIRYARLTRQGLLEFLEREKRRDKASALHKPKLEAYVPSKYKHFDLIDTGDGVNAYIDSIVDFMQQHPRLLINYTAPRGTTAAIKQKVNDIFDVYYDEIKRAKDNDDKLRAIIKCAKLQETFHSFPDANGRVYINITMNDLLMENGFPPATYFEPNIFDLYSIEELLDVVKDAMYHTLVTIQKPEFALFGYQANKMSDADKSELAKYASSLTSTLNQFRDASRVSSDEFNQALQDMLAYTKTCKWNGSVIDLHKACAMGDLAEVKTLIKTHAADEMAPPHVAPLYRDKTPLHIAAMVNQNDIVQFLLNHNPALINHIDMTGRTALHYAIENKNAALINLLIAQGADVSISNEGKCVESPLRLAARTCDPTLFSTIYAASTDKSLILLNSLYMSAIESVNYPLVKNLLQTMSAHAQPKNDDSDEDKDPQYTSHTLASDYNKSDLDYEEISPVHLAVRSGNLQLTEFIFDEYKKHGHPAFANLFSVYQFSQFLQSLAANPNIDVFNFLLKRFFNNPADLKDYISRDDLADFIISQNSDVAIAIIKLGILDVNGDVGKHVERNSLLHLAVNARKPELVKLLIEHGANVNAKNYLGLTPLHLATTEMNLEIVKLLCESTKSNINAQIPDKQMIYMQHSPTIHSPFGYIITEEKKLFLVNEKGIREIGLDSNQQNLVNQFVAEIKADNEKILKSHYDYHDLSDLYTSSGNIVERAVDLIASLGEYVGDSPLTIAIRIGCVEVVSQLLASGASVSEHTFDYLEYCRENKEAVRKLLMQYMPPSLKAQQTTMFRAAGQTGREESSSADVTNTPKAK